MNKFKEGDRVKLVNIFNDSGGTYIYSKSKSNTIGNIGVVIEVRGPDSNTSVFPYRVAWRNGTTNSYIPRNLELVTPRFKDE